MGVYHLAMGKLPAVASSRALLLLVSLVSCSFNRGTPDVTTVVFDGQTQTITGQVTCTTQPDGKLVIFADDGEKDMVRVLLRREHQLVVEKVGLRIHDARGFTDNSNEVWASKVDDTYTINGRMPPNGGEAAGHQFKIETRCRYEVPLPPRPDTVSDYGRP